MQWDKCIRCYACRQACFGCYCTECVAEQLEPTWQSIAINAREKQFFLLMRAYHLAGRCVECNECERACPMSIPLHLLNRKVARDVAGMFDGLSRRARPGGQARAVHLQEGRESGLSAHRPPGDGRGS